METLQNKIDFTEDTIMKTLQEKIDFAVVFAVSHANPNGDPLTGNRPVKPMTDMEKFPMSV